MTLSKQDKKAGLVRTGDGIKYDPKVAVRVLDAIAEGRTLTEITQTEGFPSLHTWHQWLTKYPDLKTAADNARELSAQAFEDQMLEIVRDLRNRDDFTAAKGAQLATALQQLRWSASRRDPARYGQKQDTSNPIAIQINTSLDIGQGGDGGRPTLAGDDLYTVHAVPAIIDAGDDTADEEAGETDGPRETGETDDTSLSPFAQIAYNAKKVRLGATGLAPEHREPKRHPKHKTPAQIRATEKAYARRKKRKDPADE